MHFTKILCALAGALLATAAFASPVVRVDLKAASGSTHDGTIVVDATNTGSEDAFILKWEMPFYLPQGRMTGSWFAVSDAFGHPVAYRGRTVLARQPPPEAYIRLAPGQAVHATLRLPAEYKVDVGGIYEVSLPVAVYDRVPAIDASGEPEDVPLTLVRSNVLSVYVDKVSLARTVPAPTAVLQCTDPQVTQIQSAVAAAQSASLEAAQFLGSLYYADPFDPNNPVPPRVHMTPNLRYTYWFGNYDDSAPQPPQPGGLDTDNSRVDQVVVSTYARLMGGAATACDSCTGYDATTRAWAESSLIHLCPVNFTDPITGGISSQAGTIVHEVTHQGDANAAATVDFPGVKSRAAAHALDRHSAVNSAANYEYFIMNTVRGFAPQVVEQTGSAR